MLEKHVEFCKKLPHCVPERPHPSASRRATASPAGGGISVSDFGCSARRAVVSLRLTLVIIENINTRPPPLPPPPAAVSPVHGRSCFLSACTPSSSLSHGCGSLEPWRELQACARFQAQGARPDLDKTVTLSRKRRRGDTGLEKEKLERPPEPSSDSGQAVREQSRAQAQALQGDRRGGGGGGAQPGERRRRHRKQRGKILTKL